MSSAPIGQDSLRTAVAAMKSFGSEFRPVISETLVARVRRRYPSDQVDEALRDYGFVVIPPLSET